MHAIVNYMVRTEFAMQKYRLILEDGRYHTGLRARWTRGFVLGGIPGI